MQIICRVGGAAARAQAYGTGECSWTPLRTERAKFHRDLRMISVPRSARRRRADELKLIASIRRGGRRRPVTERVNLV
jgi:hypothetical protein